MSLFSKTRRRVESIIAWVLAVIVVVLLGAGAYYVLTAL